LLLPLKASVEFTADEATVSKTVLDSGVRVLTETVHGAPSVSLSVSVGVGSRDESESHLGSTHFLEHLLFKGTARRSARDISVAFDSVGGSSNAVTAKEYTSYYARVQNAALGLSADVLVDMFCSATIAEDDFETEKTVILEELAMNEDDPEDVAHEAFSDALMPGTELGRPIGGSRESILAASRWQVVEHYRKTYSSSGMIVAAAGGVNHAEFVEMVAQQLKDVGWTNPAEPAARREQGYRKPVAPESFRVIDKDTQQSHIILGFQSPHSMDDDRYALAVFNTILGGGMSSRLYQQIREARGLAYSTHSYQHGYSDSGFFGLYAGCSPENAEEVVRLMRGELQAIAEHGVSQEEFDLALGNITGSLALRFEASLARLNRLVGAELSSGEYLSVSEVLERFHSQDPEDVRRVAGRIATAPSALVAVGKSLGALEKLA
jgi:predicted Zn-dependent peptidase